MTLSVSQMEWLEDLFTTGEKEPTNDSGARGVYNKWEKDFLTDNHDRFNEYGDTTMFSTKQWEILIRVGEHLGLDDPR